MLLKNKLVKKFMILYLQWKSFIFSKIGQELSQ